MVTYCCIASFTVKASPFNAAGVQRRADGDGEAIFWVSRSEEADIMGGLGRDFPYCWIRPRYLVALLWAVGNRRRSRWVHQ